MERICAKLGVKNHAATAAIVATARRNP